MWWDKHKPEPVPFEARFKPLPDISAYELAVIVMKTIPTLNQPVSFPHGSWETIDPMVRRHFGWRVEESS